MWGARMYRFPVEDIYRFHFKKSRGVSPGRAVEPPKPTYYYYRRDRPGEQEPIQSERNEYDFMHAKGITTKSAPFGNLDTPMITMKLVGGEYKPCIESSPRYNEDYVGSRVQQLDPLPNPPQKTDPRDFDEMPGGYYTNTKAIEYPEMYPDYYSDMYPEPSETYISEKLREIVNPPRERSPVNLDWYYENISPLPTALISRRPDSKDLSRSHYKALPQIQAHRLRNTTSTVFENEPWIPQDGNPTLARETEYKQNYHPEQENGDMEYQVGGRGERLHVTDSERQSVTLLVPEGVLLPSEPIVLSREKETILCKLICIELEGFDETKLRDIYLDSSLRDPDLNGYCDIQYLDSVLRKHGANLTSQTLRVLAAQFVNPRPRKENKVNYEKILSFIGSAIQLHRRGQLRRSSRRQSSKSSSRSVQQPLAPPKQPLAPPKQVIDEPESNPRIPASDGKPKYYKDAADFAKGNALYKEHEVAKLLRMVEQELSKSTYVMDWTRWYDAFNAQDREHRETLSADQIKDICYELKLPLSGSLQDQILLHCQTNNGDGQFYWQSFLEFLSRVRPSNTGLPIPVSKRPLDYAKHYPAPVPNWPRADRDRYEPMGSRRRDHSPQRQEYYERTGPSPRQQPSPRRMQDDKDKFSSDLKTSGRQPIYREKSSSMQSQSIQMNGSIGSDNNKEADRNSANSDKYNRVDKPRDKFLHERKMLHEQGPIYREKASPMPELQMNESPDMDLNAELARNAEPEGRYSRVYNENPSGYIPSWQERQSRLDDIPQKDLDPRFRDHNYRTYPPQRDRPRSYAEPTRPGGYIPFNEGEKDRRNRSLSPVRYRSPPPQVRHQLPPKRHEDRYNRYTDRGRDQYEQQRYDQRYERDDGQQSYRPNREEQIKTLSNQIKNLEAKYQVTKEAISSNQKPWLDRFMKLANALYNSDISNKGALPKREVLDIVRQYNSAFNLDLKDYRINELMTEPNNLDRSGYVILQPFLFKLSA